MCFKKSPCLILYSSRHEVEPDTKCIVLAIDSNKRVRTMELKIVEKCDGAGGDCYQRAVHNASDIEKDSCDGDFKIF